MSGFANNPVVPDTFVYTGYYNTITNEFSKNSNEFPNNFSIEVVFDKQSSTFPSLNIYPDVAVTKVIYYIQNEEPEYFEGNKLVEHIQQHVSTERYIIFKMCHYQPVINYSSEDEEDNEEDNSLEKNSDTPGPVSMDLQLNVRTINNSALSLKMKPTDSVSDFTQAIISGFNNKGLKLDRNNVKLFFNGKQLEPQSAQLSSFNLSTGDFILVKEAAEKEAAENTKPTPEEAKKTPEADNTPNVTTLTLAPVTLPNLIKVEDNLNQLSEEAVNKLETLNDILMNLNNQKGVNGSVQMVPQETAVSTTEQTGGNIPNIHSRFLQFIEMVNYLRYNPILYKINGFSESIRTDIFKLDFFGNLNKITGVSRLTPDEIIARFKPNVPTNFKSEFDEKLLKDVNDAYHDFIKKPFFIPHNGQNNDGVVSVIRSELMLPDADSTNKVSIFAICDVVTKYQSKFFENAVNVTNYQNRVNELTKFMADVIGNCYLALVVILLFTSDQNITHKINVIADKQATDNIITYVKFRSDDPENPNARFRVMVNGANVLNPNAPATFMTVEYNDDTMSYYGKSNWVKAEEQAELTKKQQLATQLANEARAKQKLIDDEEAEKEAKKKRQLWQAEEDQKKIKRDEAQIEVNNALQALAEAKKHKKNTTTLARSTNTQYTAILNKTPISSRQNDKNLKELKNKHNEATQADQLATEAVKKANVVYLTASDKYESLKSAPTKRGGGRTLRTSSTRHLNTNYTRKQTKKFGGNPEPDGTNETTTNETTLEETKDKGPLEHGYQNEYVINYQLQNDCNVPFLPAVPTVINHKLTFKDYTRQYLLGPFTRIYTPKDQNKNIAETMYPVVNRLREGKPVFMLGYGASGAGKTSNLIYFSKAKTDDERNGILMHLCSIMGNGTLVKPGTLVKSGNNKDEPPVTKYPTVELSVCEFYQSPNYNNPMQNDKNPVTETRRFPKNNEKMVFTMKNGQYKLTEPINHSTVHPFRFDAVNGEDSKENEYYKSDNNKPDANPISALTTFPIDMPLGEVIIYLVDRDRLVNATTNNPNSSRSHELVFIRFKGGTDSTVQPMLVIGDFAGVENEFTCEKPETLSRFHTVSDPDTNQSLYGQFAEKYMHRTLNADPDTLFDFDAPDTPNSKPIVRGGGPLNKQVFEDWGYTPEEVARYIKEMAEDRSGLPQQITLSDGTTKVQVPSDVYDITKTYNDKEEATKQNQNRVKSEIKEQLDVLHRHFNNRFTLFAPRNLLKIIQENPMISSNRSFITFIQTQMLTTYDQLLKLSPQNQNIDVKDDLSKIDFGFLLKIQSSTNTKNTTKTYETPGLVINYILIKFYQKIAEKLKPEVKIKDPYTILNAKFLGTKSPSLSQELVDNINHTINEIVDRLIEQYKSIKSAEKPNANTVDNAIKSLRIILTGKDKALLIDKPDQEMLFKLGELVTNANELNLDKTKFDELYTKFFQGDDASDLTPQQNIEKLDRFRSLRFRAYYMREICKNRLYEGKYINKSVSDLRETIKHILVVKNRDTYDAGPRILDQCIRDYCPTKVNSCLFATPAERIKSSTPPIPSDIVKEIYEEYKLVNTSSNNNEKVEEVDKIEDFYKQLQICIFCVANISIGANDPPPVPYIDINKLKTLVRHYWYDICTPDSTQEKNDQVDELRKQFIYECKSIFCRINNRYKTFTTNDNPYQKFSRLLPYLFDDNDDKWKYTSTDQQNIEQQQDVLNDFINMIDNSNATSTIGTLEFMDQTAKYNRTNIICSENALDKATIAANQDDRTMVTLNSGKIL